MHVQMRERVSMNFIVQLHRPRNSRYRPRNFSRIAHEGSGCGFRQIIQLDHMRLRHEAHIAGNRRRFLHSHPRSFQFGHDVQWLAAQTDRTRRAGAERCPAFRINPQTHFK